MTYEIDNYMTHRNDSYMQEMYAKYQRSTVSQLYQIYSTWSERKDNAFHDCVYTQLLFWGYDGKIVTHNIFKFTFGFKCKLNDTVYFVLITKNNTYYMEV